MASFTSRPRPNHRKTGGRPDESGQQPAYSMLAAGLRVEGEVQTDGMVRIEGTVVGNVQAQRQVLVAKGGTVEGDIRTREAILGGEVRGSIVAEERVEIQASAAIQGTIVTPRLLVHEGAVVDGHVRMAKPTIEFTDSQSAPPAQLSGSAGAGRSDRVEPSEEAQTGTASSTPSDRWRDK